MSLRSLDTATDIVWLPELATAVNTPKTATRSWLEERGLLTQRLRKVCASDFKLEVLRNDTGSGPSGIFREVLMCCGANPCIYAATEVPEATLRTHPWLAELGEDSLGETLSNHANVTRSKFEYACIDSKLLPANVRESEQGSVWARRSEFMLGERSISVTEIFLAGLQDCEHGQLGKS